MITKGKILNVVCFLLCLYGAALTAQEVRVIDNKGTIQTVTVNNVTEAATEPTTPVEGDVWFDTTTNISKIYDTDTTSWITIDPDSVTVNATAPSIPAEGDIWFDTTENLTKVWDGTSTWEPIKASTAYSLWDNDLDTGIQVEEGGPGIDDDIIRFDALGIERVRIDKHVIETPNAGRSVYIGEGAAPSTSITAFDRNNVVIGYNAANKITESANIVAIGSDSQSNTTSAFNNVSVGARTLRANTDGNANTAVGHTALVNNSLGSDNTAIGSFSLGKNTSGSGNVGVGKQAIYNNTLSGDNIALGNHSLFFYDSTDGRNVAIAKDALYHLSLGGHNIAIGHQAFYNLEGTAAINAVSNVAIGYQAGYDQTTGGNNIAIGDFAQLPSLSGSNQIRLGNTSVTSADIQVAWNVTSDKRWKENISSLPYGLNLIEALRPVAYNRKNAPEKGKEIGFIAQELKETLDKLGIKDQGFLSQSDEGFYSIRYNDFIAISVKAMQEQQTQIKKLQSKNKVLQHQIEEIIKRLNKLEASSQE